MVSIETPIQLARLRVYKAGRREASHPEDVPHTPPSHRVHHVSSIHLLPYHTRLETLSRSNRPDIPSTADQYPCSTSRIASTACPAHPTTASTMRPANHLRLNPPTTLNLCFQNSHRSTPNPSSPFHKHFPPSLPPIQLPQKCVYPPGGSVCR
jgi:hypothetical protein